MPTLFVTATPIGNLKDISLRALEILKEVDFILCEDTRVTKKLLQHYNIRTPTLSYHQHSKLKKVEYIIQLLREGRDLALVSDAGTPGISDPGNKLINYVTTTLSNYVTIIPIPGPSAVTAAASISGFPMASFLFLGFPPHKKKRKEFFEEIVASEYPVIFYESPYRIIRTLSELHSSLINHKSLVNIVVCRELTKKFETIYRGTIEDVLGQLKRQKGEQRGEFTVIVAKAAAQK